MRSDEKISAGSKLTEDVLVADIRPDQQRLIAISAGQSWPEEVEGRFNQMGILDP